MTDYKTVIQLAEDKGYQYYFDNTTGLILYSNIDENNLSGIDKFLELTLIQKWLRDEHKIDLYVDNAGREGFYQVFISKSKHGWLYGNNGNNPSIWEGYEQALLEGIYEALKLLP